eukprot:scaffold1786_cov398-Prasinococcus_capsulatus_cf.AAC.2
MAIASQGSALGMEQYVERTFRGHKGDVTSLAFSPDTTQIVSGSADCSVMVWNLKPKLRAHRFEGHQGPVFSVAFSPSGDLVASGGEDTKVRLWHPTEQGLYAVGQAHDDTVQSVGFSGDGSLVISGSADSNLVLWRTQQLQRCHTLTGHDRAVRSAQFSRDGRLALSSSDDGQVKLWDIHTQTCVRTVKHSSKVLVLFPTVRQLLAAPWRDCLVILSSLVFGRFRAQGSIPTETALPLLRVLPLRCGIAGLVSRSTNALRNPKSMYEIGIICQSCQYRMHLSSFTCYGTMLGDIVGLPSNEELHTRERQPQKACSLGLPAHDSLVDTKSGIFSNSGHYFASFEQDAILLWRSRSESCANGGTISSDGKTSETPRDATVPPRASGVHEPKFQGQLAERPGGVVARYLHEEELQMTTSSQTRLCSESPTTGTPTPSAGNCAPNRSPGLSHKADSPQVVSATLQHVVGQLEALTETMALMEQRLSLAEDQADLSCGADTKVRRPISNRLDGHALARRAAHYRWRQYQTSHFE